MRALLEETLRRLSAGERVVWCVILSAEGSTPRGPGAKMAVFEDGSAFGTVGGGAVEFQAAAFARQLSEKAALRDYELYSGGTEATGMVCGGKLRIVFFSLPSQAAASLREDLAELDRPGRHWLRLSLSPDGSFGCSLLREPGFHSPQPTPPMRFALETLPSGTLVLTEPAEADYRVYIFGAGHVSTALVPVLLPLGFPVTVIDQRPELAKEERFPGAKVLCAPLDPLPAELSLTERDYAVIMTPGHEQDLAVLRQVLKTPAFYIGCIGSRKKTAYVNQILREEGFSASELERIHAPIGLPIMARTPEEIAVSIAAELILHRAGENT